MTMPSADHAAPALLCLPHAGASIAKFAAWIQALEPEWRVVPLELPGRGARYAEPLAQDLPAAIDSLLPRVAAHTHRRWALFGHSLGALLAFELAHAMSQAGRSPAVLVTSGRNAPSEPPETPPLHALGDEELLASLRSYEGMPADGGMSAELLALFLPILRADLRIAEQYLLPEREPLACPVVSLVGSEDRLCRADRVAAWERETRAAFRLVQHEGGHFAVYEAAFAPTLREALAAGSSRRAS